MNIFLLSNIILFTIHMLPMNDIPNREAILKAAEQEIRESQIVENTYIITVDPEADLDSVIHEVETATGGEVTHVYRDSIKGFTIKVSPDFSQEDLYLHDAIISVEPDMIINPLDVVEGASQSQASSNAIAQDNQILPVNIARINGYLSETAKFDFVDDPLNVNIAIIDTGVDDTHPDLNVVYSENFIKNGKSGRDDHGHGTHVAGTAAARDNGIGVVGVAPGARIYSLKVLNDNAWGYLSDIIQAIDWVSKQSKPLSSNGGSAQDNYENYMSKHDKSMRNYSKYLDRANGFVSRVQNYQQEAEEYTRIALQYLNQTPSPDDKNVLRKARYQQQAVEYQAIALQYLNGVPTSDDKNIRRAQEYRARAEEYKIIAYEYLNSNDLDNYNIYIERYEKYLSRAESYEARFYSSSQKNYEKYLKKSEKALSRVVSYQERIERSFEKNYQKYMKKAERALSRAEKYQSRIQKYQDRANGYLAEAEEYKRLAQQYIDSTKQIGVSNPNKIDVVNISIGAVGKNSALHSALRESVKLGVTYVVSAGNDGTDIFGPDRTYGTSDDIIPASYPEVAAVSAMNDTDGQRGGWGPNGLWGTPDDTMAGFSNNSIYYSPNGNPVISNGQGIDIAAPGVNIYSTWVGGGYRSLSGTSMAAPHVTGAIALLIIKLGQDANGDGRIDEHDVAFLRQMVMDTAQPQSQWKWGDTGDPDPYHEGILQVSGF